MSSSYGNIAPKTPWGKIVTILYAIIGIPLLLLCLSNIGDAMAHSFKFIYWKVCCYLCVRPKKRRKRTPNSRSTLTVPYRQPVVVHQQQSNCSKTIQHPPVCRSPVAAESPPLHSSSTYNTAPSCSSPTISTPASTPRHHPNENGFSSKPSVILNNQLPTINVGGYYAEDIPLAPVITNKYALQEDKVMDDELQLSVKETSFSFHHPSAMFAVLDAKGLEKYQYEARYKMDDSLKWNGDPYSITARNAADDESIRTLSPDLGEEEEVSVPMWLCVALVASYICGGAVLFTFWEKWNFLDSSYFCFVTLTTIGFGDLVPGTAVISDDNQLTLGLCSLYLLFGMALLAMSFNLVQEEVTRSMRSIGKKIGIISDDDD